MNLTFKPFNKKASRLVKKLINKTDDPQDLIDTTILLTLLVHECVRDSEGVEVTRKFLDQWLVMVKYNVEHLVLDQDNEEQ
jgi:hypothetical protein